MKSQISRHSSLTARTLALALIMPLFGFTVPPVQAAAPISQNLQPVSIVTLEQEVVQGELVSISPEQVEVVLNQETKVIPSNTIESIRFKDEAARSAKPYPHLVTTDQSVIAIAELVGKGSAWNLSSSSWSLTTPLTPSQIQIVRLKQLDQERDAEWSDLLDQSEQSDSVIAQRPSGELTRVSGTIISVESGKVQFDFDGEVLEMPIDRLAGLTWYQRTASRTESGITVLTDDGSLWNTATLSFKPGLDQLQIETFSKIRAELPTQSIVEIRMGNANIAWVKDVDALHSESTIESKRTSNSIWNALPATTLKAFTPRFINAGTSAALNLQSTTNRQSTGASGSSMMPVHSAAKETPASFDLQFLKPGFYEFRMPEGFKTLECLVTRPDRGQIRSEVKIEIWQDTERVLEEKLAADEESKPIKVSLLEGKRIRLVVIDPSEMAIGTEVLWKQPRLLK